MIPDNAVSSDVVDEEGDIPAAAALLFMPVDKRAFGTAIGVASSVLITGVTIAAIASGEGEIQKGLGLLSEYFAGYSVSPSGVIAGALWAFVVGFVVGWLIAFTRNLSLAVSLFLLRSRAELGATSDFLDHI